MLESETPARQRAQQKADTRERILKTTKKLIEQRGFVAMRTQDVAKAAGISHGSIFAHFKTRDELILAVASCSLADIDAVTRKTIRESTNLETFLRTHLKALAAHEFFYTRIVQELHLLPKEVRARVVEINSAVSSHLGMVLGRKTYPLGLGSSESYFLFNTWMGLVTYYLLNRDLFTTGKNVLAERGHEIVGLFLKMITKGKHV